ARAGLRLFNVRKYIARRILLFIPTLAGVSIGVFLLLRVIPGDVAQVILAGPSGEASYTLQDVEELREKLGLNDPLYLQYGNWVSDLVRGDLGTSFATRRPIAQELKRQFPVTLQLAFFTMVVVSLIAIPIGVLAAVKQDSAADYILRGIAILGLAAPTFFVGLVVVLVVSRYIGWLPPLGYVHIWDQPFKGFQQLIFPALVLGFSSNGLLLRMTRTQLLEVLREDYVRTARSKGLSENVVIVRHAMRNALLPVVTVGGLQLGGLFTGAVIVETIFNLPGIGRGLIQGVFSRDLPLIEAYIMYFAVVALVANLLVDLTYAWLDPRIRYE
ncbi:MAG TPA: glutathione ABC transporter permease GsiC, partial [Dehalococcoidia bacterium]|nr:glutathione ABC transporter permease GsiC [Dehalococcoidia bacterium]